jgi:subtilase family serine protease
LTLSRFFDIFEPIQGDRRVIVIFEMRKILAACVPAVFCAVPLLAQTVDLTLSIESSREEAFAETVMISVTVKNEGTASSRDTRCELIVRNARPPRQVLKKIVKEVRGLEPGESFTFKSPMTPGLGTYEICATVDPKNKIAEQDETNNKACLTLVGK